MSDSCSSIFIGANSEGNKCLMNLRVANRHGLIAGATGTGKTVTLQSIAEQSSRARVPVFTADVKGDLSGMAKAGQPNDKITERLARPAPGRRSDTMMEALGKSVTRSVGSSLGWEIIRGLLASMLKRR